MSAPSGTISDYCTAASTVPSACTGYCDQGRDVRPFFPFGNIRCGGWEHWPKLLSQVSPLMLLQVTPSDFPPVLENQLFQREKVSIGQLSGAASVRTTVKMPFKWDSTITPQENKGKETRRKKKRDSPFQAKRRNQLHIQGHSSRVSVISDVPRTGRSVCTKKWIPLSCSLYTRFACLIMSMPIHFIQSNQVKRTNTHALLPLWSLCKLHVICSLIPGSTVLPSTMLKQQSYHRVEDFFYLLREPVILPWTCKSNLLTFNECMRAIKGCFYLPGVVLQHFITGHI